MQIIIEPEQIFTERTLQAAQDALAFTAADPHIIRLLQAGPQRIMAVVNAVGRLLPSTCKRQRVAIKQQTLRRITVLIRRGTLKRIRRVFIGL